MIPVTNLRAGTCFTENNELFQVLSYEHIKLGRGTANIRVKVKNLKTGAQVEKTFISGAKVEEANLEKKEVQYLYREEKAKKQNFVFMDPVSFEQFELSDDKIGKDAIYLKEGMTLKIIFYQGEPLAIELPIKMDFLVVETGPEIRGNSATNIFKDATLENGLKVKVPLFVKTGERVLIDTRTGEYVERLAK